MLSLVVRKKTLGFKGLKKKRNVALLGHLLGYKNE
jgi:hypothetical protein